MKLNQLKAIAQYISSFKFIKRARRVDNNLIELNFGKDESLIFDMTRGHSTVYIAPSQRPAQEFNAPFDTLLNQMLSHSQILSTEIVGDDRILKIYVRPKSKYKDIKVALQLEFTGKHTNAILLDNNGVVIEALHHIDSLQSFRVVRPGVELEPIPSKKQRSEDEKFTEDIEEFLRKNYENISQKRLKSLKAQKIRSIEKKISHIQKELNRLPNQNSLEKEAEKYSNFGNIILANLYKIKPYDKYLKTIDFEGNEITIPLPKKTPVNRMGEFYFKSANRAKSKAKRLHIEEKNLKGKLKFYKNIYQAIESAKDTYELELLLPKKGRSKKKKEKLRDGELYWIEGYKVYVGRNSRENQKLLEIAKANDIWMHTRDLPGSHVIIRTDKQNLPNSVLESAAKLCVDFTTDKAGDYEVDYTKRKFVKIQQGSNVEYDKYKTISVTKKI